MATGKSRTGTFFKRGIRALLPTVLTIWVFFIVYNFFAQNIVGPVNRGIEAFLVRTGPGQALMDAVLGLDVEAPEYRLEPGEEGWEIDGKNIDYAAVRRRLQRVYPAAIGIVVALLLVFTAGFLLATFVGRSVLGRFETAMGRFPLVKIIYPYARQVVEFFMREKAVRFHSVVAIEYPRRGLYSVGFVTGHGMRRINEAAGGELINVFIPSSPTPVTGYVTFVPARELIPIPITVDEAVRFAISGGVLVPESQRNPEGILDRFAQIVAPSIGENSDPQAAEQAEEPSSEET